jgi:hypothetical protein
MHDSGGPRARQHVAKVVREALMRQIRADVDQFGAQDCAGVCGMVINLIVNLCTSG